MSRFRFLIALVFVAAPIACANVVYTYNGAPFDTEAGDPGYVANPLFKLGDSIDLMVDFSAPLAPDLVDHTGIPVSWSFELGGGGFVSGRGGSVLESSTFSTDSFGKIDDWFFSVFMNPKGFSTSGAAGDEAFVFSAHGGAGSASTKMIGTWTGPAAVPEPSTLNLVIPGLTALFFLGKRRYYA